MKGPIYALVFMTVWSLASWGLSSPGTQRILTPHTHCSAAHCREPRNCWWDSLAWRVSLLSEAGTGPYVGSGLARTITHLLP